uniref:SIAH-type domain-containing protein n=1 Tax=Arundo donax TaxID=35708 RepID=A0A0A9FVC8_ARUDO
MAEQRKRGSPLDNGEQSGRGKRPRAQEVAPSGVVKQERPEVEQQEDGEVSPPGSGAAAVPAVETMEEPQIHLILGVSRFHCRTCLLPLKPPTFKCEAEHIVCGTCRSSHSQACSRAATYAACADVDAFVRDAKLPCPYEEFGCKICPVYYQAADHKRACQWAPCRCPVPGCDSYTSPPRLVDHIRADHAHAVPVTDVGYRKPYKLAVPPPWGFHVLVGEEDRCVFLVSASALGAATSVSLVSVRANGDAAAGAQQFKCKLWVEAPRNGGKLAMVAFLVASSDLSGGFVAAEQGMFLAVPPELLPDASGETPDLVVRIDKAGAASSTTPPARRLP